MEMEEKEQFVAPLTDEQIVRYLLDDMDEGERSGLEEHLSREPSFFEVISATEDDMIMKYVRGDLEGRLLPRFTEIYLNSPSRRARVEEARLLRQAVRDAARSHKPRLFARLFASQGSRLRFAVFSAAAAAILLFAVLLPFWKNHPLIQKPQPQDTSQLRVPLEPGLERGGAGVQITLPAGTKRVQFELTLPKLATHQSYHAVLKTPERPVVWNGLATRKGQTAAITVPADVLAAGDYTLEFEATGEESVAAYYFRVVK